MGGVRSGFPIVHRSRPTFYFVGVTTSRSSIMRVFPAWMRLLGREEVVIEGVDCRIHDEPGVYRRAVAQIKEDELSLGGLVTTHKIDLLEAARDMFDYLDSFAEQTGEISSISKREGRLEGHAKDPISAGLAMDAILGPEYFGRTGAELLIFGAGGSSAATILHLLNARSEDDRPRRLVVVNRSQPRLDSLRTMIERHRSQLGVELIRNADPAVNDQILASLPDSSVVINATGMGKDTPGSPITGEGRFPANGMAWEFNYRGELDFLHQARAQSQERGLRVEDGWLYFLHGWTQVIAQVLHIDLDSTLFGRLARAAEELRGA